jgi:sulfatase maturation enzyme AslB (radical SAM superfamily)
LTKPFEFTDNSNGRSHFVLYLNWEAGFDRKETTVHLSYQTETVPSKSPVDFLWLELTNQCNLQCTHCYADSGPHAQKSTLSASQYIALMSEAFALGCRRVQFIGGEPTLNLDLPKLITAASGMGFEFIEVYTNLTRLPQDLLQSFVEHGVRVATSVYASAAERHDVITQVNGSFDKTIKNLQRLVKAGVSVRAGIIEMDANVGHTESTVAFLRNMGVTNVDVDKLRRFGRGAAHCETADMSELCGNCAGSTLCVSPTGQVSPCIMSKRWSVGSATEGSLTGLINGDSLREIRMRIHDAVTARQNTEGNCNPMASCSPTQTCSPQGCSPNTICFPSHCDPNR